MNLNDDFPTMMHAIKRFLLSEDGPTAVEYSVMLALILAVVIIGIGTLGGGNSDMWENNEQQISSYMPTSS